jgi:hypothetical protein
MQAQRTGSEPSLDTKARCGCPAYGRSSCGELRTGFGPAQLSGVGVAVARVVIRIIVQFLPKLLPLCTGGGGADDPAHDNPGGSRGSGVLSTLFPPLLPHFMSKLLSPFLPPLPTPFHSITSQHDRGCYGPAKDSREEHPAYGHFFCHYFGSVPFSVKEVIDSTVNPRPTMPWPVLCAS